MDCKAGIGDVKRIDDSCNGSSIESTCVFNKKEILSLGTSGFTSQDVINELLAFKITKNNSDIEIIKKGIEEIKNHLKL